MELPTGSVEMIANNGMSTRLQINLEHKFMYHKRPSALIAAYRTVHIILKQYIG
jgi:hypothetical protein